jgi:diaminohydroxyphosphoribosylaminopyrimidine deaminase/5-amino-6-(5-phosphoribosylamino)uracil reductase
MRRCLELAAQAAGFVAPNPMVGCVIVHDGKIIGEGFHRTFGQAHAEVNAIESVSDRSLLAHSTLYVNLEPCSHFGKTPPCADLIIANEIPEVIIGCHDPNPEVSGNGVKKLRAAHCHVHLGVLETECEELNRRFFTFHKKQRPYIILKWAQSTDGFMAPAGGERTDISNEFSRTLLHRWRSEEAAIMVGTNTALRDNPVLDARRWNNHNPVRVVLDRELKLSPDLNLFDHGIRTIVITEKSKPAEENLEFFQTAFSEDLLRNVMHHLHHNRLQSVLVEGGARLIQSFIAENLWDEMRVFISPKIFSAGLPAPRHPGIPVSEEFIAGDRLLTFKLHD